MAVFAGSLAFIGAPWQILVLVALAVGLFAPHLLPRLGRMLGRMVRAEALRRLGLSSTMGQARTARPAARTVQEEIAAPAVELLMPHRPAPTLRAQSDESLATQKPAPRTAPFWLVSGAVVLVSAAIFWLLLHSR